MVHGLIGEARDELFGKLMMVSQGGEDARTFHPLIGRIPSTSHPRPRLGGHFWMMNETSSGPIRSGGLFKRVYQEQALQEQFFDADGKLKDGAGEAYQQHIERFLLLICFLICFGILVLSFIQVKAAVFNDSIDRSGYINILYIFEVLWTLR
jgi:hypothetical protein